MIMIKKLFMVCLVLAAGIGFTARAESEEEQIAKMIASMNVKPGQEAPDFTLKDLERNDISLNQFKGKWVVLDFWGSWCRYCIAGIPDMKEAYEKYHSKGLEIIGIDCNEPQDAWKNAVEKYQLPWVNVYNPAPRGEGLGAQYGIKGYPTKILIDPTGSVYSIYLGEDPAFYSCLSAIFD